MKRGAQADRPWPPCSTRTPDQRTDAKTNTRSKSSTSIRLLIDGSAFVTPDHIREMAVPVLAHRLVLDPQAKFSGVNAQQVVDEVLRATRVPA